ncbi:MAG: DUF305 domain-containing protein [Anaerolineae bacterium]|nr:DUF305 domain-containing protein [Anaerolineae bacterium]
MNIKYAIRYILVIISVVLLSSAVYADAPIDGRAGRAEVRFLEGMIDHHQMALDMAADCLNKAQTESIVELCNNVITAQSAEIAQMQEWLLEWYDIEYAPMSMMDMDSGMSGMHGGQQEHRDPPMMMGMMAGLSRLEGVEYEIAWLEAMIDHHDDALHMSERILRYAQHDNLIALAEVIISAQTTEIEYMESLIIDLSE